MKETRRCSALLTPVLGLVLVARLIRPQEIVAGTNTFDEKSIKQWTLNSPLP